MVSQTNYEVNNSMAIAPILDVFWEFLFKGGRNFFLEFMGIMKPTLGTHSSLPCPDPKTQPL